MIIRFIVEFNSFDLLTVEFFFDSYYVLTTEKLIFGGC